MQSDQKHVKAPLTAAKRSTHDLGGVINCRLILRREENQSAQRKTLGVRLRSTNNSPHIYPRQESNPSHGSGRSDCSLLSLLQSLKIIRKPIILS